MSGDKGCLIPARRGIQRLTSVDPDLKRGLVLPFRVPVSRRRI